MKTVATLMVTGALICGGLSPIVAAVATASGPVTRDAAPILAAETLAEPLANTPYYNACGVLSPREPSDGQLDCLAPGHTLDDLFWTSWTRATATATGRIGYASALSDTATYRYYDVDVRLSAPKRLRNGVVFTRMTLRFPGARPAGTSVTRTISMVTSMNPGSRL